MIRERRNSNIELLRIISMFMIIASHFCLHGIFNNTEIDWNNGYFFNKIVSSMVLLGNVGVGCFFIITGYFSKDDKRNKLNIKIIADIIFFSSLNILFIIIIKQVHLWDLIFTDTSWYKSILRFLLAPITGENWWFATAYIYLILFIVPLINKIVGKMDDTNFFFIILVLLLAETVSEFLGTSVNRVLQASVYYLIGKFIKKNENLIWNKIQRKYIFKLSVFWALHTMLIYFMYSNTSIMSYVINNSILTVILDPILAIMIFVFFLKSPKIIVLKSKYINRIAKTTFSIYLLHDSKVTRKLLWNYWVPMKELFCSRGFVFYEIIVIAIVFIICSFISAVYIIFIRNRILKIMKIFENPLMKER